MAKAQDRATVVAELWTAGIPVEIAQTGGFVMVAYVNGADGHYLGITESPTAAGGFMVCGYRDPEDCEGYLIADLVRPEHLADYARGFIRSHGVRGPAVGDRVRDTYLIKSLWYGTVTEIDGAQYTVDWDRSEATITNVAHLQRVEASVETAALAHLLATWTEDFDTVYDGVRALIATAEGHDHCTACGDALWSGDGDPDEGWCAGPLSHQEVVVVVPVADPTPLTISVGGEQVTIPEARVLLGIPEAACFGCYLGDAAPATHDVCPIGKD